MHWRYWLLIISTGVLFLPMQSVSAWEPNGFIWPGPSHAQVFKLAGRQTGTFLPTDVRASG